MGDETAVRAEPVRAQVEPRVDRWTRLAKGLGVTVGLMALVTILTGYVFWGMRYGTITGVLVLWFFLIPSWVIARFHDLPMAVAPTTTKVARVSVVAAVLLLLASILAVSDYTTYTKERLITVLFGIAAVIIVALPVILLLLAIMRAGAEVPDVLLEPSVARSVVQGIVGILLGVAALWLLIAPFAVWAEPYLMMNNRDGFTRMTEAWNWIALPAASMGAAYPAAWAFGLVQRGFLSASYVAARRRRRESSERLRGRLDDHYALHRVTPQTHGRLRSRLMLERDGQIPGESDYIAARGAAVNLLVLGLLMILAVALAWAGSAQAAEWNAEAELGTESQIPYWPCTDCQSEEELEGFLDQVRDWRTWSRLLWATAGVFGLYVLVSVSNLFAIMDRARREVEAFWADRDRLEEQMLEEVRAATAPQT